MKISRVVLLCFLAHQCAGSLVSSFPDPFTGQSCIVGIYKTDQHEDFKKVLQICNDPKYTKNCMSSDFPYAAESVCIRTKNVEQNAEIQDTGVPELFAYLIMGRIIPSSGEVLKRISIDSGVQDLEKFPVVQMAIALHRLTDGGQQRFFPNIFENRFKTLDAGGRKNLIDFILEVDLLVSESIKALSSSEFEKSLRTKAVNYISTMIQGGNSISIEKALDELAQYIYGIVSANFSKFSSSGFITWYHAVKKRHSWKASRALRSRLKEGWNKYKTNHSDQQLKNDIALLEEKEKTAWKKSFLREAWFPKEKKLRNMFVEYLNIVKAN